MVTGDTLLGSQLENIGGKRGIIKKIELHYLAMMLLR